MFYCDFLDHTILLLESKTKVFLKTSVKMLLFIVHCGVLLSVVMYILTLISGLTLSLCNVNEGRGVSKSTNTNVINVQGERGGVAGGGCEDDVYKDCQRRVEAGSCTGEAGTGDAHQEVRTALAECRKSCRDLIYNNHSQSELPSIVRLYGGIEVERYQTYFNIYHGVT